MQKNISIFEAFINCFKKIFFIHLKSFAQLVIGNGQDLTLEFKWIHGKDSNSTLYESANQLNNFTIGHLKHENNLNSTFYEIINLGQEL